jgi:NDP-sugar pyrophosphorylase family protein
VVLAAGMGSRYGGLKQVDPVGPSGELVIDYSVYDALAAGFGKLVFVIRRDIEEDFREAIGSRFEDRCEVRYAFQELDRIPAGLEVPADRAKPWGTGHAMLVAGDAVREPCAVINADDFYGRSGFQSLATHLRSTPGQSADFALVGFVLRNTLSEFGTVSRGLCQVSADGLLEKVSERTRIAPEGTGAIDLSDDGSPRRLTGDELVSMNMWGFTPPIFPALREAFARFMAERGGELKSEFYLPAAVDAMVHAGEATVRVLPSTDQWFGITYREDKPHVTASVRNLVAEGVYRSPLWQ